MTMTHIKRQGKTKITITLLSLFAFFVLGCQKEGSMEKAGEKLDQSLNNAEQKIEQITEEAGKKIVDAKKSVSDKMETGSQYLDDSAITLNVKAAIANDSLLKVTEIKVSTLNGIVQLSGALDSQEKIDRALEIAKNQKGVKFVQNDLTLISTSPPQ
jgi:hyperosmotically inducible protein